MLFLDIWINRWYSTVVYILGKQLEEKLQVFYLIATKQSVDIALGNVKSAV